MGGWNNNFLSGNSSNKRVIEKNETTATNNSENFALQNENMVRD